DALYNLYSATKPVTCVAALILYEKGEFLLTDPLYAYIPEFKTMYVKGKDALKKAEKDILIRDLFTMCAGFNHDIRVPAIMNTKKETGQRCPTLSVVRALAKEPLDFEPGTRWQYSLCHDVLGGLVEAVSGKTLEDFCKEHIFEPLSMQNTSYLLDADKEKRLAPLYMFNEEKQAPERISSHNVFRFGSEYQSGGAGLVSGTEDYIKFAECLASGGKTPEGEQIISARTIDLMRTNHLSGELLKTFDWPHLAGYGYGLGVRTMVDVCKSGSNGPVGEFGWGGAAGAYVQIDPENELAVYYAQHMLESKEAYIHPRLRNVIYACL
ncbi:MAG: beta-lactamase family protein, partial [Clostridia bacterium]|nr:beta-lactamase family protein [Clostridia bacterium]